MSIICEYCKTDFKNNYAIPKLMQHIVKWDRKYKINSQYVFKD